MQPWLAHSYTHGNSTSVWMQVSHIPQDSRIWGWSSLLLLFLCSLAVGCVFFPQMQRRHQSWVPITSAFLTGNTLLLDPQKGGTWDTHQHLGMCWLQGQENQHVFSEFTKETLSTHSLAWPYKDIMVPRDAVGVGIPGSIVWAQRGWVPVMRV